MATDKFEFTHKKKDADGNETQMVGSTIGSVSFKQFIGKLLNSSKDHKLSWKKRELLKAHKLQLLALVPHILKDQDPSKEAEAYKLTLDFISSRDGLCQHSKTFSDSEALKSQIEQFDRCFSQQIEFNPSSGVASAITS